MTYSKKDLKQLLREDDLPGDPWGVVMTAWFDVANELHFRDADIPGAWEFKPSPCEGDLREESSAFYEHCLNCDDDVLVEFGNLLQRYSEKLEQAGESY